MNFKCSIWGASHSKLLFYLILVLKIVWILKFLFCLSWKEPFMSGFKELKNGWWFQDRKRYNITKFVYFSCRNEVYNSTNKLHMEGFNHTYYTQMSTHLYQKHPTSFLYNSQITTTKTTQKKHSLIVIIQNESDHSTTTTTV